LAGNLEIMDIARLADSPIGSLIEITGTDSRFQEE
jgi:hypothetical protein